MAHSEGVHLAQLIHRFNAYAPVPRRLSYVAMSPQSASPRTPGRPSTSANGSASPPSSTRHSPARRPNGSDSSKNIHVCDQCSRAFSRAEHLERHQTTHMPSAVSKSFICPSCNKGFTRKDVLTRHVRAVHETKKSEVRKSRRKSCRRCATFKIKCTGGEKNRAEGGGKADEPCEACKKRDIECIFDFGAPVPAGLSRRSTGDSGGFSPDDDMDSESDTQETRTGSSEYSVKRRKTNHGPDVSPPSGLHHPASDVSPHLLSAARLASSEAVPSRDIPRRMFAMDGPEPDFTSPDAMMDAVTGGTYFTPPPKINGVPTKESTLKEIVPRNNPRGCGDMSHLFFTPMRGQSPPGRPGDDTLRSIPEEDLNAASTLQGIKPNPSPINPVEYPTITTGVTREQHRRWSTAEETMGRVPVRPTCMPGILPPVSYLNDYERAASELTEAQYGSRSPPMSNETNVGANTFVAVHPEPRPAVDFSDSMALDAEDNWFFDFGIFDNQTDWLRDWGTGASSKSDTSDQSQQPDTSSVEMLAAAVEEPPAPSPLITAREASPKSDSDSGASMPGLPQFLPMKDHVAHTDFLPWGWHGADEGPRRKVTLPPLRQVLPECADERWGPRFEMGGKITERLRAEMIRLLALPATHPPYPREEGAEVSARFPTEDYISEFIKLYFKHFHSILPVIHKATFCVEKTPSILLVAMLSIGASYSHFKNAKAFADNLSELCKRCLMWMAEGNPEYSRSVYFLTALCLQNLYAMGSGSHSLYDAADVSRSILIGNARRIGLFSGNPTPAQSSPPSPRPAAGHMSPPDSDPGLEHRWQYWKQQEGFKRLAWGIFEYDSSFSTLSNRRGAITLSDICTRMPCSEALWEAPTAAAWRALFVSNPTPSLNPDLEIRGFPFYPTLKDIMSGRQDARTITSWGKRICAQAMGRIMWDVKELEESVLAVAPAPGGFAPQKDKLLRSLALVRDSARTKAGDVDGDAMHLTIARVIAHYTHLTAAFPTISLMLSIARKPPVRSTVNTSTSTTSSSHQTDPRVQRLRAQLAADAAHSRSLAWHAAQIVALSRYRPVFSPVEGMRIFVAGIVLWAFGLYFRPTDGSSTSTSSSSLSASVTTSPAAANICSVSSSSSNPSPPIAAYTAFPSAVDTLARRDIVRLDALDDDDDGGGGGVGHSNGIHSHGHSNGSGSGSDSGRNRGAVGISGVGWQREGLRGRGAVEDWIRSGRGRACVAPETDGDAPVPVTGEDGAREALRVVVRILNALRVWGLGGEFRTVLEELVGREV